MVIQNTASINFGLLLKPASRKFTRVHERPLSLEPNLAYVLAVGGCLLAPSHMGSKGGIGEVIVTIAGQGAAKPGGASHALPCSLAAPPCSLGSKSGYVPYPGRER